MRGLSWSFKNGHCFVALPRPFPGIRSAWHPDSAFIGLPPDIAMWPSLSQPWRNLRAVVSGCQGLLVAELRRKCTKTTSILERPWNPYPWIPRYSHHWHPDNTVIKLPPDRAIEAPIKLQCGRLGTMGPSMGPFTALSWDSIMTVPCMP